MRQRPHQLAKLSRPHIYDVCHRPRLYDLFDQHGNRPVVWLVAPPGSGKTTTVSAYLELKQLNGIWYQADADDADPATFFYYLSIAERSCHPKASRLPLLTEEYLRDVQSFARRYFRKLFDRFEAPATLVLDNIQELPPDGMMSSILATAFQEIPAGFRVFVISRADPPACYSRLVANRMVKILDWADLKFSGDEARDTLNALTPGLSTETIGRLADQCGGWAVGLILLSEQLRRAERIDVIGDPEMLQSVFGYFAQQVLAQIDPPDQRTLLQLSFLPTMTERLALRVSDSTRAPVLLETLFRRHLFTNRRTGTEVSYEFHALFRSFLQHRVASELCIAERTEVQQRTARALEEDTQPEAACALYVFAEDWDAVNKLVCRWANTLIAQGRWRTVVEWINALPSEYLQTHHWLYYWLGVAQIGVKPQYAREMLKRAFALGTQSNDTTCVAVSAAGIVETYLLEYIVFAPLGEWIPAMEGVLRLERDKISVDHELRVLTALLMALTYRQPDHSSIDHCISRLEQLIDQCDDNNLKASVASNLALHGCFTGTFDVSRRAVTLLLPLLNQPNVTSLRKVYSWAVITFFSASTSDHALGEKAVAANRTIAREESLHEAERFACTLGYLLEMDQGSVEAGSQLIKRFEQIAVTTQPYEAASLHNMKSWHGVFTGNKALTLEFAPRAVAIYQTMGSIPQLLFGMNALIWALVEDHNYVEARRWIALHRSYSNCKRMSWSLCIPTAAEAIMALNSGNPQDAIKALQRIFAEEHGRLHKYSHTLAWCRTWAPKIAAAALEHGVNVIRTQQFIREFGLAAPTVKSQQWPWPIRIQCLGGFAVEVDGKPLRQTRKTPRKLLQLLKLIIALGGKSVPAEELADTLWPEEEGDTARQSLTIALHRLRKLLGSATCIVQRDGRISLDPQSIWVDVFAFEQTLSSSTSGDPTSDVNRAIQHYRSGFLPDDDTTWANRARRRLRDQFVRYVAGVANQLERAQMTDQAIALYRDAIDAEALAEPLYQGLIRGFLAAGKHAEATEIFQRLRATLAAHNGSNPSPVTVALVGTIALGRL